VVDETNRPSGVHEPESSGISSIYIACKYDELCFKVSMMSWILGLCKNSLSAGINIPAPCGIERDGVH
jgi:hypothetical protein